MPAIAQQTTQQPADTAETASGQDIIVTAQKIGSNLDRIGMSINAISADTLTNAGISSPEQLTKAVPGLNVTRSAYGTPVYTMRGIGFYDVVASASPAVSLYLDETPLPYPIMARGAALDVARVEVLKGPQGTLFGQNSTGGAVNYIANRPGKTFQAGVDASYASYDRVQIGGFISAPLSDTLGVRVAGRYENGGAWQKSNTRDERLGTTRFFTGRVLLDWRPSDRTSFQLNVNGWVDKSDEQAGQFIGLATAANRITPALRAAAAAQPAPSSARQADWDPIAGKGGFTDPFTGQHFDGYRRDDNFVQASLRGDFEMTDALTLTSITAFNRLDQDNLVDTDGTAAPIYSATDRARIRGFSQELRFAGTTGPATWVAGGNIAYDDIEILGNTFNTIGTQPFRSAGTQSYTTSDSWSAFAHTTVALAPQFDLVAGIRYTSVVLRNRGCTIDGGDGTLAAAVRTSALRSLGLTVNPPVGGCVTIDLRTRQPGYIRDRLAEDNVPFNIGLNWKLSSASLLYASVSRGYKAGSFSPTGAVFSSSLVPATQERVVAYEAGFKLGLVGRTLQLNGALFHYDYADKQVRGKIDGGPLGAVNRLVNIPSSRARGAEIELAFTPSEQFRFNAGATYVDSKITGSFVNYTATGLMQKELAGEALPLTPKWQAQADAEASQPLGSTLSGFVGGHFQYQGSSYSGLGEEAPFFVKAYATIDLRLGVRHADGRWSLTAFVDNVTNRYSWNAVTLSGPDAIVRQANPPRIFGIRASSRF